MLLSVVISSITFCFVVPACHEDMYGPDCRLSCKCQNGGVCSRFSGCHCPTGWRGQNCETSGRHHHKYVNPLFPKRLVLSCVLSAKSSVLEAVCICIISHHHFNLSSHQKLLPSSVSTAEIH